MRVKKNETNLRKRSRSRKALLLGLALLLALSPVNWGGVFGGPADGESGVYADTAGGSDGGGSAGDTASGPAITVVGVNVKNTDTLEVGIQVGGPDQPLFQSVGLVLEYDRSRLTPMDWQPGWQTVESQTTNVSGEAITTSSTAVVAGQEDWKSLAVYTPTWINSGTAQVYDPGDGTGVGAAGKGYLLLQANTEYPYSLPTARQIVTVKFQYTGDSVGTGGAITPAASFADVGLDLAGAEGSGLSEGKKVAYTSRIKHVGLYHTGNAFYYNGALRDDGSGNAQEDPTLAGQKLAVNFGASIVEGETQQAAGGGTGDVAVLSFYDWDETMLGNSIISKTAGEEEIKEALTAFSQSQYAVTGGGEKPTEFPADLANESYVDNAAFPLTYKKGYNFAGWVRADGKEGSEPLTEAFTAYETLGETPETDGSYPEGSFNAARWKYEAGPNGGSWGNIVLKAGYVENAWCQISGVSAQYLMTYFEGDMYGNSTNVNSGNISIAVTAERVNNGLGVRRLKKPALRAVYTLNGVQITFQIDLANSDVAVGRVVIPKSTTDIQFTIVDLYGSNISMAGSMSQDKTFSNQKGNEGGTSLDSYIVLGALHSISKRAAAQNDRLKNGTTSAEWTTGIGAYTVVQDVGLTWKDGMGKDRYKILLASYGMGADKLFEKEELQEIIDLQFSSDVTIPSTNPNAAVYAQMQILYDYLDKAIVLNNGEFLTTIQQVKTALESHGERL